MACGRQLQWYEMIPVLSWVALHGRCRSCFASISVQYPLVELSTAILFALVGGAPIWIVAKILGTLIASLLVMIAVYDIRHTIIPDEWSYAFAGLAFMSSLLGNAGGFDQLTGILLLMSGPLAALPLLILWVVSQGRWMGLGDPKLALGIGWLLGFPMGIYAVFFAFLIGAVVSVFVLLPFEYIKHACGITRLGTRQQGFTMKSEVPFGPFLIASCVFVWCAMMYMIPLPLIP